MKIYYLGNYRTKTCLLYVLRVTGPIQEEDGRSAEDIVHDIEAPQKTASPSQGSGGSQKASVMEPNVDFEMDIKVDIDSGRCVLHPKEPKVEPESEQKRFV